MTTPGSSKQAAAPSRSRRSGGRTHAIGAALGALVLAGALACGSDVASTNPNGVPIRFIATNALAAPVTIALDGTPLATLTTGRSTGMTVSSRARALTWTSAKPTDADNVPIPDDIGEIAIPVGTLGSSLEISNVIGGETYVTAELFNLTTTRVSIGVWDGARVACAAILPAMSGVVNGYVRTGYYRLLPATEFRAYSDPTSCTGTYVAWPHAELSRFVEKSGVVQLVLDTVP